jgi:RNase P subunit RPR2
MVKDLKPKSFTCVFDPDVLCSYRYREGSNVVLDKCLSCEHYRRFSEEMEKEEAEAFDEFDRLQKEGY